MNSERKFLAGLKLDGRPAMISAVRSALAGERSRLSVTAGLAALGLASPPLLAATFPPELELSTLLPANGGNGTGGFILNGAFAADNTGQWVSEAGDVNGDGVDDLLVGATGGDPGGRTNAGQSYVVFGRDPAAGGFPAEFELSGLLLANGGNGSAGFALNGIDAGDRAGVRVSGVGDVNGDGIDDLIVGADLADPTGQVFGQFAGQSYVVFGRTQATGGFPAEFELSSLLPANGGNGSAGFVLNGIDADDRSGVSVSKAGDVNGDGIADLVIGAIEADPGGRDAAGESYVVFGRNQAAGGFPAVFELSSLLPANGGNGSAGFVLNGIDVMDYSGVVSEAGDVNGDGVDDLIVGAFGGDPGGQTYAGESYVVFGRNHRAGGFPAQFELSSLLPANGGNGSAGFVVNGIDAQDQYALSAVSKAGDVNGDGIDDLLIGVLGGDPGGRMDAGESYVVFGRDQATGGFSAVLELSSLLPVNGGNGSAGFVLNGIDAQDQSAYSVSAAGDVNGDGVNDLLVGANLADPGGRISAGESYVVFGRPAEPMCDGVPATIVGTDNADLLVGTARPDVIQGLAGNDAILGLGGNDILCGGAGNDAVQGNSGNDRMFGEAGVDALFGGAGEDRLNGGDGNDRLFGGAGRDELLGDPGNDALFGDAGNDGLLGGNGADRLFGGTGNDRLAGGDGNDRLSGEAGNDAMDGGPAIDRCNGDGGNADTAANCEQVTNVP